MTICDQCKQPIGEEDSNAVPLRDLSSWKGHGNTYIVLRHAGDNIIPNLENTDYEDLCTRCSAKNILQLCVEYEARCLGNGIRIP